MEFQSVEYSQLKIILEIVAIELISLVLYRVIHIRQTMMITFHTIYNIHLYYYYY